MYYYALVIFTSKIVIRDVTFFVPGSLSIKDSQETDQGDYECVAENAVGTEYSYEAKLYVRGML